MAAITRTACCAASLPVLARRQAVRWCAFPVGRFDMASRALDFGAEAVIAPMVNSVADAQALRRRHEISAARRALLGADLRASRATARATTPTWLRDSNRRTLAFAMIETRAALDALDGILATPGIDGIFLGPSDFSIAWTNGSTVNPTLESMMETVDLDRRPRTARPASMRHLRHRPGHCRPLRGDGLSGCSPWAPSTR